MLGDFEEGPYIILGTKWDMIGGHGRHQQPGFMRTKCRDLSLARSTPRCSTSHLPDDVGQCGSARHNSSYRRCNLGAINRLRETSEGEAHSETARPLAGRFYDGLGGYTKLPWRRS
jgi:hypothetical protein